MDYAQFRAIVMTERAELFSEAFETEVLELAEGGAPLSEWAAAGKGKTKSKPNGEDGAWWRANGPKMVDAWVEWRRKSKWAIWTTPDGQPAIELPIEVPVPGGPEPYKGYIDRVFVMPNGTLVIVDLKTGSRTPESDLQLGTYRFGLWQKYQVDVGYGAYWMARAGTTSEIFPIARLTPALVGYWFRQFVKAREAGIFLPHPTFRCRACAMRDYCAAYGGSKSHLDPDYQAIEEAQQ